MTRHCRLAIALATATLVTCVWLGHLSPAQADATKPPAGATNPPGLHPMPPVPHRPHHPSWQQRQVQYPYAYAAPVWPSSGYWAYVWVPQVYSAWVLVPAGFRPDGTWVDEHAEPRFYDSGYYQPAWVGLAP